MRSPEALAARLRYDPETGHLFWVAGRQKGRRAGCVAASGYVVIRFDGHTYMAHRLAWLLAHGVDPTEIDHRNRDRADNRLANLRLADRTENNANRPVRRDSVSGIKGVQFHRQSGKWRARIKARGKAASLGLHETPELAGAAYMRAAKAVFGEFAA